MKTRLILSIAAAAVALAIAVPAQPSFADSTNSATTTHKKIVVHKKRHIAKRHHGYPELEPYRSYGFVGKFPGSCAYDRAAGNCMIDLGYGRCVPCDYGGGGRF